MYKKCWGCNKYKINILAWLANGDVCNECKRNLLDPVVAANYKANSKESQKISQRREKKQSEQNQKIDKVFTTGKGVVFVVFGTIALLLFVIMLVSQSDFKEIVIGWAIIGGIYLFFRAIT